MLSSPVELKVPKWGPSHGPSARSEGKVESIEYLDLYT